MYNIILFLIIFLSFLLVLVIMVQNPKGGGLASTFGGDSQQIGGVKKTTDFLDRSTWILASLLLLLILFSNITLNSGNDINESELLNNTEDVFIEEILENDTDQELNLENQYVSMTEKKFTKSTFCHKFLFGMIDEFIKKN